MSKRSQSLRPVRCSNVIIRISIRASSSTSRIKCGRSSPLSNRNKGIQHAAGWVFVISAALAWYTATAMMLKAAGSKVILPLFKTDPEANKPGAQPTRKVELGWGEPGIKAGQ